MNILFLWTDQQRPDTIGAFGNEAIRTPHLDRLAAASVLFEHAYCAQAVCSPSRASVLTGVYPHAHGVVENNVELPRALPTLAELLRTGGYACGYVGKWHLGDELRAQRGFEDFWSSTEDGYVRSHESEGYSTYHEFLLAQGYVPRDSHRDGTIFGRLTAARLPEEHGKPAFQAAECVRFLEANQHRPFLLMCNFLEPHPPVTGPRDGDYAADEMVLPPSWYRDMEPTVPLRYRDRRDVNRNAIHYRWLPQDDEAGWKQLKTRYWGLCTQVDHYVGVVLQRLEELGLADNTIVIYSSDHGDMMGEHRLLNKGVQYEGSVRVPLILRIPGVEPRRVTTPVSQVSLVPTLLDALDLPAPAHCQAKSILPLALGAAPSDEHVVVEWNGYDGFPPETKDAASSGQREWLADVRTIRGQRWKLNVHLSGEHELYDLANDSGELHNLAFDSTRWSTVEALTDRLRAWQRATKDPLPLPDVVRDIQAAAQGSSIS